MPTHSSRNLNQESQNKAFIPQNINQMLRMSRSQAGMGLMALAALSGLAGFIIVYHYATLERPMVQFSMVIDAGSTQTRSNLFTIKVDTPALADWIDYEEDMKQIRKHKLHYPLSKLLEVRQVGACVNGNPLALIKTPEQARHLVETCVGEFSSQIKHLNVKLDPEKSHQQALKDFRVNSVTHVHMGATAGMRALQLANSSSAEEKVNWINEAIGNISNELNGPHLNKGYLGIISGLDEAAYDWVSVNFVCDQLEASRLNDDQSIKIYTGEKTDLISYETMDIQEATTTTASPKAKVRNKKRSIGILEMGGASMQMAFESGPNETDAQGMSQRELELFNERYKLQLRSDLCMGTSQAILRSNYILLRDIVESGNSSWLNVSAGGVNQPPLLVTNPCLQNNAQLNLNRAGLRELLTSPCINQTLTTAHDGFKPILLDASDASTIVSFRGTGQVDECNRFLTKLIEPSLCQQYFSICPSSKGGIQPPEAGVPFVTISGYNKAVEVLELDRAPMKLGQQRGQLELKIASKLGGFSIVHEDLMKATRKFCSVPIENLSSSYPKLNLNFMAVNCLQLVYLNKILTEFYGFNPQTESWEAIKFLVFPVTSAALVSGKVMKSNSSYLEDSRNDIGWTLGLLLNETSHQYGDNVDEHTIFYHHGASVAFVLRATLILMLAVVLIALSLLMLAVFSVRRARQKAYISHPDQHLYYEPEEA